MKRGGETAAEAWIDDLREARKGKRLGGQILFWPQIDSTNRAARDQALQGSAEGLVVLADRQTQGRGRLGRSWESPPGVNLYFSVLLRPPIAAEAAPQLTLLSAVAGARALSGTSGLEARIKWPNDLLVRGKKLAGILAQMEARGPGARFIILGLGVNVNWRQEDMPGDLQETATSLRTEAGREFCRARVAAEILEELEKEYDLFVETGFSSRLQRDWNDFSWVNERWVAVSLMDRTFEGKVLGLDTDGALLLQGQDGHTRRFVAGEVSLRL